MSPEALKRVSDRLRTVPTRKPTPNRKPPVPKPQPLRTRVLARPYAHISGPRHIPKLCTANGIPFLRFKKPQSPILSGIIRQKIKTQQKRYDYLAAFEQQTVVAGWEDQWDRILQGQKVGNREGFGGRDGVRWVDGIEMARKDVMKKLGDNRSRNTAVGREMGRIVERERELVEKEREKEREKGEEAKMAK